MTDQTPPDASPTTSDWILRQLTWFVPLVAIAVALGMVLSALGSRGNQISGTWALPTAIVGEAVTVLLFMIDRRHLGWAGPPPEKLRRRLRMAATLTVIPICVGLGLLVLSVLHKPDIPITDRVVPSGGQGMREGGQATIQIPGNPPLRRHLVLTPILTNRARVGDCVTPAQLAVTTVIDGQQRRTVTVRSDEEVRLDLADVTHQASVIVTLHMQDPSCSVDLGISQAVLYN